MNKSPLHTITLIISLLFITKLAISSEWDTIVDFKDTPTTKNVYSTTGSFDPKSEDPTQTEDLISSAVDKGADYYKKLRKSGKEEPEASISTVDFIKTLEGIEAAGVSADECTIWLEDTQGSSGTIIFKPMEQTNKVEPEITTFPADDNPTTPPNGKRAIILEPFETTDGKGGELKNNDPEKISKTLKDAGITVTHLRGKDVSVEELSKLGKYDIVYIHTHCGYKKTDGSNLMSGEKVTDKNTRKYQKKYGKGVGVGKVVTSKFINGLTFGNWGVIKTYKINGDFIRKNISFKDTIVYVSGCNSNRGKDGNSMAKALKEKGASIYLGYTGFASPSYVTHWTDVQFFKYLVQHGLSVEDALKQKPNSDYGHVYPSKFSGLLKQRGNNPKVTIDIANDKRIELLKAEHRSLQQRLLELRDKIQTNPRSNDVKFWEKEMSRIRVKQKEIYLRVLALKKASA